MIKKVIRPLQYECTPVLTLQLYDLHVQIQELSSPSYFHCIKTWFKHDKN